MIECPNCKATASENDKFCGKCGSTLMAEGRSQSESQAKNEKVPRVEYRRIRDLTGLISFGFLLVIVGAVFYYNPHVISDFISWVERLTIDRVVVRPPERLITSVTIFFGLVGLSDYIKSAIRLASGWPKRLALSDAFSATALVTFAYLLQLYRDHAISWQMTISLEIVSIGVLVMLYGILRDWL